MMQTFIFPRFRPVTGLFFVYLFIGFTARIVLWWHVGPLEDVSVASTPAILLAGIANDTVQSLYLFAPLSLYILLMPDRWYRHERNKALMTATTVLTLTGLIYLTAAEYYFFEEFNARFNIVAFNYLIYPTEVIGDLWQEYPVMGILTTALVCAVSLTFIVRHYARHSFGTDTSFKRRLPFFMAHAAALVLAIAFYPTDTLSFSSNRVANELLQNGLSSFFRAAATSEIDYHAYYASASPQDNLQLLAAQLSGSGSRLTGLQQGRLDRQFAAHQGLGKLNVIVISSESFGAEFSRLYGSQQDLTPNFDAYARRSLWFQHTYASGTRTVRGLEALSSSFPPIPTESILRRPGNEHIATWGAVMRELGYHTSFLYGGYGYFDNMNYFFGNNGFEVIDRQSIEKVRFANIWGVSDEDLFDRALEHFDAVNAGGQPLFSIVMTTSNHKPFTFRKGLAPLGIPEQGGGREAGVKYADYALGYFLKEAQRHTWFDNTLFVVVADHGARVYGKAQIPLKTYEIPLLMYAPKHLQPRSVADLMTQIDVAPTVMGLLGLPYHAPFFGQDVLTTPAEKRVAFFNHNNDVAIYRNGEIVVFGLQKSVRTYSYDRGTDSFTSAPRNPELERLGIAYFQTAYELFETHRYTPSLAAEAPTRSAAQLHAPASRP